MRPRRFNPLHLAGWLFADMLLVLALIAMGGQGDPLGAAGSVSPGSTLSPSARPRPSPTRTGLRAVERRPVKVSVDADVADTRRIVAEVRSVTARYGSRQAAIVLTFGRNPDAGAGVAYAHRVNTLLAKARPAMFLRATTRDFVLLTGATGHADLEIYFYTA